jgi:C4-type Zn-finger protein
MITGKIEVECPDCGGTMAFQIEDKSYPWNESPEYKAKCDGCGLPLKLWIMAEPPEREEEGTADGN